MIFEGLIRRQKLPRIYVVLHLVPQLDAQLPYTHPPLILVHHALIDRLTFNFVSPSFVVQRGLCCGVHRFFVNFLECLPRHLPEHLLARLVVPLPLFPSQLGTTHSSQLNSHSLLPKVHLLLVLLAPILHLSSIPPAPACSVCAMINVIRILYKI